MQPTVQSFWLPKRGNTAEEYEDAYAHSTHRFAVSDGASEGWQSGEWAARLAAAFVAHSPAPIDFAAWLDEVRRGWPSESAAEVPWYAETKRAEGSFATLLGVEFRKSQKTVGWAWKVLGISWSGMGSIPASLRSR